MMDWWHCPTCRAEFQAWPIRVEPSHFIVRCRCGQQIVFWWTEVAAKGSHGINEIQAD